MILISICFIFKLKKTIIINFFFKSYKFYYCYKILIKINFKLLKIAFDKLFNLSITNISICIMVYFIYLFIF